MTRPYAPSRIHRVLLQFKNLKKMSDRNITRNCDRGRCSIAINTAITIAIIIASSKDSRLSSPAPELAVRPWHPKRGLPALHTHNRTVHADTLPPGTQSTRQQVGFKGGGQLRCVS
jgi:hypothetical protein